MEVADTWQCTVLKISSESLPQSLSSMGVASVSLFGSYSKGTASSTSDVDLKIEKGKSSLFQLCGFRLAVEDALKLPVDLVTSESSDRTFLDMIKDEEVLLYRNS